MSFILDALRRAEAERQRGAVPGLHAQPGVAAPLPSVPEARRGLSPVLMGLGALALLLAGAGLAWWSPWRGDASPVVAVVPASAPALAPPVVGTPAAPLVVVPTLPSTQPVAVVATAPAKASATAAPALSAGAKPATASDTVPPAPNVKDARSAPLAAVQAPAGTPALAPSAPARLPSMAELPEAQRRELAALALGGVMYAEQPTLRMVIINGQVFHEGDKPTADLQVLQIRLKSVVFSHRGQRFEMHL